MIPYPDPSRISDKKKKEMEDEAEAILLRQDLELYHRAQVTIVKDRQRYARRVGKTIPPDYVPGDIVLSQEKREKLRADRERISLSNRRSAAASQKKKREEKKKKIRRMEEEEEG